MTVNKVKEYDNKIPEATRNIMDALSDPSRRALVMLLLEKSELSFTELLSILKLDPSALTFHLKKLVRAGLLENIYKKSRDKKDYSIYKLSELGKDFLKTMLVAA